MESKHYIDPLNQIEPLSIGLKTYLGMTLSNKQFNQGERIAVEHIKNFCLPYLSIGCIRLAAKDMDSFKESTLFFFYPGDFLMPLPFLEKADSYDIFIEFMEASELLDFDNKQLPMLLKIFPEMSVILSKLHARQYNSLLDHLEKRNTLTGTQHYQNLIFNHPVLLQFCHLDQLASFLGLEANTLSHIRSNLSSKR